MELAQFFSKYKIKTVLTNYPVELLLSVVFFVVGELTFGNRFEAESYFAQLNSALFFFPIVFAVSFTLNVLSRKHEKLRLIYFASILLLIPLAVINVEPYIDSPGYGFGLLLSVLLLFICYCEKDNVAFSHRACSTLVNLIIGLCLAGLVFIAITVIILSIQYIFSVWKEFDIFRIGYISMFLIFPYTFCYFEKDTNTSGSNASMFSNVLVNYILSPAIVIYTAILYLYFIQIAVSWELPKGGITEMIMAFYIVAMLGKMFQHEVVRHPFNWFFKHFSLISIVPIIMFWVSLLFRIEQYSWTQPRVYLALAGLIMTISSVIFMSKRVGRYQYISIIAAGFIIIFTYIPGISARSIGIASQENRLEKLIETLKISDTNTGKLLPDFAEKVNKSQFEEVQSVYRYLVSETEKTEVEQKFGKYEQQKAESDAMGKLYSYDVPASVGMTGYPYYSTRSVLKYKSDDLKYIKEGNEIIIYNHNKIIIKAVLPSIAKIKQSVVKNDTPEYTSLFTFQNDSVKIVYSSIYYHSSDSVVDIGTISLFTKHPLK